MVEKSGTFVMADLNNPLPLQSMKTKIKLDVKKLKLNIPKWVRRLPAGVEKVEWSWGIAYRNSKYYYEQGVNCCGEIIYYRTRRVQL